MTLADLDISLGAIIALVWGLVYVAMLYLDRTCTHDPECDHRE